jgi:hypothetical protein
VVKVSIEVSSGTARFSVAVQAESIRRAVSIMGGRYPNCDIRVKFPLDPEGFFVNGSSARAGIVQAEQPERIAA